MLWRGADNEPWVHLNKNESKPLDSENEFSLFGRDGMCSYMTLLCLSFAWYYDTLTASYLLRHNFVELEWQWNHLRVFFCGNIVHRRCRWRFGECYVHGVDQELATV